MDQFHNIALIYPFLFFPIWCKNAFKKKTIYISFVTIIFKKKFFILKFFYSYHYIVLGCPLTIICYWKLTIIIEISYFWSIYGLLWVYSSDVQTDQCLFIKHLFIFFFILCLISNKYLKKKSLRPLERCSNFKFETNAGFFN